MNAADVAFVLDQALPDSKVIADLRHLFEAEGEGGTVSIELNAVWTPVPIDAPIEIVLKIFKKDHPAGIAFGTYVVTVAIGGFQHNSTGFHHAGYCFADLFYNEDGELATQDFYRDYIRLS